MTSIVHFIVTRFNVRDKISDSKALESSWLDRRFELFEKFCFPTVRSQSEQNFKWLVLFDSDTPELAKERIKTYCEWGNFVSLFVPAGSEGAARKAVVENLAVIPDILVTTRLDNDDGICRTFVESIQERARVPRTSVLDFPSGYVWHRNRVYQYHFPFNPFATLAELSRGEGSANFKTVYTGSHSDLGRLGEVIEVSRKPSWLQVIHGGNLENTARGVRVRKSSLSGEFAINEELIAEEDGRMKFFLDRVYTGSVTGVRSSGMKFIKMLRR